MKESEERERHDAKGLECLWTTQGQEGGGEG